MIPFIALNVNSRQYDKLIELGNRVIVGMTGNLYFTTPSPTLASLQTNVDDTANMLSVWGPAGNRGSHDDLLNLRAMAVTLHQSLKAMAQYVQNTAEIAAGNDYVLMGVMMNSSGFELAKSKTSVGPLQAPQNLHILQDLSLNPNQVKGKFKRPLNTNKPSDVDSYALYRGTTADFSAAIQIDILSKTEFIDTNTSSSAVTYYYWVVGYNAYGAGAVSDVMMAKLAAA